MQDSVDYVPEHRGCLVARPRTVMSNRAKVHLVLGEDSNVAEHAVSANLLHVVTSVSTKTVVVNRSSTVQQVKEVFASVGFGDPDKQRMMLGDTEMLDHIKLQHYGVEGDDALVRVESESRDSCCIQ